MSCPEDAGREAAWRLVRLSLRLPWYHRDSRLETAEDALRILAEYDEIGADRGAEVAEAAVTATFADPDLPLNLADARAEVRAAFDDIIVMRERHPGVHATRTRRAARAAWHAIRETRVTAQRYGWADQPDPKWEAAEA